MLHFPIPSRIVALVVLPFLWVLVAVLLPAGPAGAQGAALGTADDSPIAVPFLGDYEVWCTDRNPAPGNRCSSHHGSPAIDLGMDPGTPLYAAGSGIVIEADSFCGTRGWCNNGKGNVVVIEHSDGTYSRYLHMAGVSVVEDQVVTVGDAIGTSGESGQSSSPHLHYDEHFPFGSRTDMGQWVGCVNGQQVLYPDVFGTADWNEVPYGSRIVNDSFDCLDGFDTGSVAPPRILAGSTHFAVTPPSSIESTVFQVRVDLNDGSGPAVTALRGTAMLRLPAPATSATIAVRQLVDGTWQRWSSSISYRAGTANGPFCHGLAATTTSTTGTPDADVIFGTNGDDRIDAGNGHDVICGGGGNDTIIAGNGLDVVFGGNGHDNIMGGKGNDIIMGGNGADIIRGGKGADTIWAQYGHDAVRGGNGADFIHGGPGDDVLRGMDNNDRIKGGLGSDVLQGHNGHDILDGGVGDDSFNGGNGTDRCLSDSAGLTETQVNCEV